MGFLLLFFFQLDKNNNKKPQREKKHTHTGNTLITLNNFWKNQKIRTKNFLSYNSLYMQLYSEMVPKYLPKEVIFTYKLLIFWYYTINNAASNTTVPEPALADTTANCT